MGYNSDVNSYVQAKFSKLLQEIQVISQFFAKFFLMATEL